MPRRIGERKIHSTVVNNFENYRLKEILKLIKRYNYTKDHIFIRVSSIAKDVNHRVIEGMFSINTCERDVHRKKHFWDFYYSQMK